MCQPTACCERLRRGGEVRTFLLVDNAGVLAAVGFLKKLDGIDDALVVEIAAGSAFVIAEPGKVGLDGETFAAGIAA